MSCLGRKKILENNDVLSQKRRYFTRRKRHNVTHKHYKRTYHHFRLQVMFMCQLSSTCRVYVSIFVYMPCTCVIFFAYKLFVDVENVFKYLQDAPAFDLSSAKSELNSFKPGSQHPITSRLLKIPLDAFVPVLKRTHITSSWARSEFFAPSMRVYCGQDSTPRKPN
jgi:hypothetical protein